MKHFGFSNNFPFFFLIWYHFLDLFSCSLGFWTGCSVWTTRLRCHWLTHTPFIFSFLLKSLCTFHICRTPWKEVTQCKWKIFPFTYIKPENWKFIHAQARLPFCQYSLFAFCITFMILIIAIFTIFPVLAYVRSLRTRANLCNFPTSTESIFRWIEHHHSILYIWMHYCLINLFSNLCFPLNCFPNNFWHHITFLGHSWVLTSCFQRGIYKNSVNADLNSRMYITVVQHFHNWFSLACMSSTFSDFLMIIVLIFSKISYMIFIWYYSWYPFPIKNGSSAAES